MKTNLSTREAEGGSYFAVFRKKGAIRRGARENLHQVKILPTVKYPFKQQDKWYELESSDFGQYN
jgi:hypothetical protein